MEIKSFGQTFDFDAFSVVVRCFAVSAERRRFELQLVGPGRTAVVDVGEIEQAVMPVRISQAVLAFADCIRLSRRS